MQYIKRISALFLALALAAGAYAAYWGRNVERLTLVYTSDGHGHVMPEKAYWEDSGNLVLSST